MTRHLLRLATIVLLFLFSTSLLGCGGNQPNANQPTGNHASSNTANTAARSGPSAYEGYHDITSCNGILAWAWDKNHPDDPVKLDIYDGNLLIDTVTADGFRQDLLEAIRCNLKILRAGRKPQAFDENIGCGLIALPEREIQDQPTPARRLWPPGQAYGSRAPQSAGESRPRRRSVRAGPRQ